MSEVSQGPGWWLASDGRWYSPEQAPDYVPQSVSPDSVDLTGGGVPMPPALGAEAGTEASPGGFAPSPAPITPGSPYGYEGYAGPPGMGPPPAYGYPPQPPPPYYPYGPSGYYPDGRVPYPVGPMVQARQTNPFAVASLVCACVGIIPFLGILGVILGFVFGLIAKGQIKRTGGAQEGSGLATAGIIISVVVTALWIIFWIVVAGTSNNQLCTNGSC